MGQIEVAVELSCDSSSTYSWNIVALHTDNHFSNSSLYSEPTTVAPCGSASAILLHLATPSAGFLVSRVSAVISFIKHTFNLARS